MDTKIRSNMPAARAAAASEVAAAPSKTQVAVDYSKLDFKWAEHANGTGYPGTYNVEGRFGPTHEVSLSVEPNGDVRVHNRHFDPDPELGGVASSEPSRVSSGKLSDVEKQQLVAGLRAIAKLNAEVATLVERLAGTKAAPLDAKHLAPDAGGQAVSNGAGVRGLGYTVE